MSEWDKTTVPWTGSMSDDEYFALDAWDQSQLKQWMISPAQWQASKGMEQTPAMRFGTAAHALVLGSGAPVKAMEHTARSKAGQAEMAQAEKDGVTLLPQTDYEAVTAMAEVTAPVFRKMRGHAEQAMIARDDQTGLLLKGKADWLPLLPANDGIYYIYDYKTSIARLDDFARTAILGGYDIQAAFYMRLWHAVHAGQPQPLGFRFLVQEKKPPYDYEVWSWSEESEEIEVASQAIDLTLQDIKNFRDEYGDATPSVARGGLDHRPQDLEFASWMFDERQKLIEKLGGAR